MNKEKDSLQKLTKIQNILKNINNYEIESLKEDLSFKVKDKINQKKNIFFRKELKKKLISSFSKKRFAVLLENLNLNEKEIIIDYINNHYLYDLFKKKKRKQLKKLINLKPYFIKVINDIKILNTVCLFTKNNIKNFCSLLNLYLKENKYFKE